MATAKTEEQVQSPFEEVDISMPIGAVNITLSNGEVLKTSLLDLHYLLALTLPDLQDQSTRDQMKALAQTLSQEYSKQFTWGEAAFLVEQMKGKLDELKKNS